MITGKTAQHHGATLHNTSMRTNEKTIGHVLAENGYATHFIGKAHFSSQQHAGNPEQILGWRNGLYKGWNGPYAGFETTELILGHSNSLLSHYGQWLEEKFPQHYKKFIFEEMKPIDVTCGQGTYKNKIPEEAYSSTYVGERTCEYIKKAAAGDKPFYCFASFPDPHWPIYPPEPWFSMYDNLTDEQLSPWITPYAGEKERSDYPPNYKVPLEKRRGTPPYDGGGHFMPNPADAFKITRPYWGSVSLIDKNIGKIMSALDECGITENTIVVFTTDHGDYMGAHGWMAKGGFVWEEFIHIPYIVRWPGTYKPARTGAYISLIDAVPTLLESVGLPLNSLASDGVSQHGVLTGASSSARDSVLVTHFASSPDLCWPDIHVIIKDGFKLIYYAGAGKGELYNLARDPRELDNLYEKPDCEKTRNALTLELLDRLILERDKQPMLDRRNDDGYNEHAMIYKTWEPEFKRYEELMSSKNR